MKIQFLPWVLTVDDGLGNVDGLFSGLVLLQVIFASCNPQFSNLQDAVSSGQDVPFVYDGTTAAVAVLS